MANEKVQKSPEKSSQCNNTEQQKTNRKNGFMNGKILEDQLSDMSIEDMNPVITLSSFDGDDESLPMEVEDVTTRRSKGTLKQSLSLDVPSLLLEDEAKRPPL